MTHMSSGATHKRAAGMKSAASHRRQQHAQKLQEEQDKRRPKSPEQQAKDRKKKWFEVGVVVFGILMALGMMLPSLAPIFSHQAQQQSEKEAQDQAQKSKDKNKDADASSNTSDTSSSSSTSSAQDEFSALIDKYEARLKKDDHDLAALLNLGNAYFARGQVALGKAQSDSDKQKVAQFFAKAQSYFDAYLALKDSKAVHVNKAMCAFYQGDAASAQQQIQSILDQGDYAPAWVNLGIIYELQGKKDEAQSAFQKAKDADEHNEYGIASLADMHLMRLKQQDAQSQQQSQDSSSTGNSRDLADKLNSNQ